MKILLIHTYYTIRGGEDVVFEQEGHLLSQDNEVETLALYNKSGIKGFFQFLFSIWNIFSARKLEKKIKQFTPELVHFHNLHFAGGPLLIRVVKKSGIPIVMTLHNYRLLCPSAILLHNAKIFTDSLRSNFPWKAIKYRVYRNSYAQTFWLAFVNWFHKRIGTWRSVNTFIMLTEFAKKRFIDSSFDLSKDKFAVKPNFITNENIQEKMERNDDFLFIGRLSEEKGIDILLKTFENSKFKVKIVGDGPLAEQVKTYCQRNSNIQYLGRLPYSQIAALLQKCSVLLFPSIWYEGMPMTIIEAFSTSTPVICSNLGAMSEMIIDGHNGLFFEVGSIRSLQEKMDEWAKKTDDEKKQMRKNAYAAYKSKYTPEINKIQLERIYRSVCK